jgi:hypothetical protein
LKKVGESKSGAEFVGICLGGTEENHDIYIKIKGFGFKIRSREPEESGKLYF